jgi:mannose-6-phosphate isomerase-like protein (cupin superfamily)
MSKAININEKLSLFNDHWNPRIIAELNGQHVKVAKLLGEFPWHMHENEDELFYVVKGELRLELEDENILLKQNEFFVVPKGVLHRPIANKEVSVLLFEPAQTINTGNLKDNAFTKENLGRI